MRLACHLAPHSLEVVVIFVPLGVFSVRIKRHRVVLVLAFLEHSQCEGPTLHESVHVCLEACIIGDIARLVVPEGVEITQE